MVMLKPMEKKDIEICGEIHYCAFYGKYRDALLDKAPKAENDFRNGFDFLYYFSRYIEDSDKHALCIIGDDITVGYITALEMPTFGGDNIIYIDNIAVSPQFQKKGYGTAALKQFMEMFPGSATKRLLTDKKLPAYKMYEKLGFLDMQINVMESSNLLTKMNNMLQSHEKKASDCS